jgi:hypothetical protein
MSGVLNRYNPKEVTIVWDGIILNEGITDGTFVTVSRNTPTQSLRVGGDGSGTLTHGNDRSGTVSVILRTGSKTNALLSDRMRLIEKDPPEPQVGEMRVEDFSSDGTVHFASRASLQGFPEDSRALEEGDQEWIFLALDLQMNPRGNLEL